MGFSFGKRSEAELAGVHPDLVRVIRRALVISDVDFMITDGPRTEAEQRVLVEHGASWTMNSRHRVGASGFGNAADLTPYLNGKPRPEWPLCYRVARAMWMAAEELLVPITWGGVWDRRLGKLNPEKLEAEVNAYGDRQRAAKGPKAKVKIDGPHFELPKSVLYP